MKLTFLWFAFATITTTALSQTTSTNELLISGNAKINAAPDVAILNITIKKTDTIEKKVIEKLNQEVAKLNTALIKIGFDSSYLKISRFDINAYDWGQKNTPKTYHGSNEIKLKFALDKKLIDKFYKTIHANNLQDIDISFEAKLSDSLKKSLNKKAMQLAIEDAFEKASNMAAALGVKLGNITRVNALKNNAFQDQTNFFEAKKFTPPSIVKDEEVLEKTEFGLYAVEEIEIEENVSLVFDITKP